jgi:mannitol-1-phosphate 5-dehydrogenase
MDADEQYEHVADLLRRFRNRRLGDTVFRLGRDPVRKLASNDRLVGAALLVLETGGEPDALSWGIAAALRFDPAEDPVSQDLQGRLSRAPVEAVLSEISGLEPGGRLSRMIVERYQALGSGQWPPTSVPER